MNKILILGATGSLANVVIPVLLAETQAELTLFSRHTTNIQPLASERVRIVQGDVLDLPALTQAMQGQTAVFAALSGDLPKMANNIIQAMHSQSVKRLIFVSSMGIYGETGEDHGAILEPYRRSAAIIEQSDLAYTLLRPAWFTHSNEVDYHLTHKGEAFQGHSVSRRSIADLIAKLVNDPSLEIRQSVGIGKV